MGSILALVLLFMAHRTQARREYRDEVARLRYEELEAQRRLTLIRGAVCVALALVGGATAVTTDQQGARLVGVLLSVGLAVSADESSVDESSAEVPAVLPVAPAVDNASDVPGARIGGWELLAEDHRNLRILRLTDVTIWNPTSERVEVRILARFSVGQGAQDRWGLDPRGGSIDDEGYLHDGRVVLEADQGTLVPKMFLDLGMHPGLRAGHIETMTFELIEPESGRVISTVEVSDG